MGKRAVRLGLANVLAAATVAAVAGPAQASPVSFPHGTIDSRLTTTKPNAASGFRFDATYHAAGDPDGNPPYMRRMTSYNPPGLRFDTTVPERCSASDAELAAFGAGACPAGSRLGGGTSTSTFSGRFPVEVELDYLNNANEQIIVARSPFLATVSRGRIRSDGTVTFASPTCFPSVDPPGCPVDNVLQLSSSVRVPPYTRESGGVVRSYLTTPPTCPAKRRWETPIRLWWADGSVDTVVTRQPCRRRARR